MKQNANDQKNKKAGKKKHGPNEMQNTGGADNTAASRSGTTDMNSGSTGGAGTSQPSSGLKTKRNVTGSDYDGQA